MRIAAPGRTGRGRWGYRDGWAIVIRISTGLDMRAPLAAMAADRISRSAILVAGVLCGRAGILRGDPARVIQSVSDIEGSGVGRSPLIASYQSADIGDGRGAGSS